MGSRLGWNLSNGNPILIIDMFCHKVYGFISIGSEKFMGSIEPIEPTPTTPLSWVSWVSWVAQ